MPYYIRWLWSILRYEKTWRLTLIIYSPIFLLKNMQPKILLKKVYVDKEKIFGSCLALHVRSFDAVRFYLFITLIRIEKHQFHLMKTTLLTAFLRDKIRIRRRCGFYHLLKCTYPHNKNRPLGGFIYFFKFFLLFLLLFGVAVGYHRGFMSEWSGHNSTMHVSHEQILLVWFDLFSYYYRKF